MSSHKEMTEETREKYTKIAYTKAKRLEDLIEDLFGLTKLSYGKMTMHISQVDIVKLIAQLMEEFYPSFAESRLAFALTSNVESLLINADPNLIARLFDNLINNAIKYGVDGKRVDVSIERLDNQVIITVTNYGKVIPEAELPLIFNKLYRVEQSRASETGGTGLGLAIAKNIAELHGGDIDVKSDLNGTSFVVRLKTDFDINRENFEDA